MTEVTDALYVKKPYDIEEEKIKAAQRTATAVEQAAKQLEEMNNNIKEMLDGLKAFNKANKPQPTRYDAEIEEAMLWNK